MSTTKLQVGFKSLLKKALQSPIKKISLNTEPDYAAVSIVFQQAANQNLRFLMIRRAINDSDPWSGQMAFPGGKKESSDINLDATVVRETREEVGLDLLKTADCFGRLDEIQGRTSGAKIPLIIAPYVYWIDETPEFILDPEEVHSTTWVNFSHCLKTESHRNHKIRFQDNDIDLPCIEHSPVPIWGISYLMLKNLTDLVFALTDVGEFVKSLGGDYLQPWRPYPVH
ncbi:hypothetical protein COB52_03710 [Candidatus Kaiserbacteria bacterium]|nr:MAG: hypothetical protein COB52_03710 [Candidatus Kaiserbacteria bacterium]